MTQCPLLDELRAHRAYLRNLAAEKRARLRQCALPLGEQLTLSRDADMADAILAGRARRKEPWQ